MKRREFMGICLAGTAADALAQAAVPAAGPALPLAARRHGRVRLVDRDGKPIMTASLKVNHNYVFNYPYAATPCFLLKLDRPLAEIVGLKTAGGGAYAWPGGVGGDRNLVAYSAICAHKLAYPTRQVSFIGFRATPGAANARGKVITCCADKSVYDPFAGARVISGPAPQPLAAILLEHDATSDQLWAVGTLGGEKFNEFFEKYDFKLNMEMGSRAKESMTGTAILHDLAGYSSQTAQC